MTDGAPSGSVFMIKRDVRKRMRCSGQMAATIKETFVTVEQLIEAIESDTDLEDRDGVGPKTAETIREWWDARFEREEAISDGGEFERTGPKTATIHINHPWTPAIGESPEGGDDGD